MLLNYFKSFSIPFNKHFVRCIFNPKNPYFQKSVARAREGEIMKIKEPLKAFTFADSRVPAGMI